MPANLFRLLRGLSALLLTTAAVGIRAQPARNDSFILHFAFDRSDIRASDEQAFHLFFRERFPVGGETAVAGFTDVDSISISGYTDTVGSTLYNDRLSLRRAMAVAALVRRWSAGASALPIRIEGRGEAEAIPGDDSASRRVVLICWLHPAPPPVVAHTDTVRTEPDADTVFALDDIRFVANTAILTDAARFVLPKYIAYLLTLKDRYLEVDGYCNSPGPPLPPTDPLYILSVQRAKFIYDCLVEKGFDPGRLIYKGKGNTNPRNAHPTTRGESDQNMRVEIRVYKQKPGPPDERF